ncbi:TetR/AcrR family transcriptional regulator [Shewanella sp. AS1]|uniref:TetR/AcrR family transcriptional regulator n=1 Tax=Shewanella sp. AS1 TaxID=2907626 RepID=UPI001F18788D|nr:TetR/AcrR family transcriptional regulator [Shewanella sp. AS1]MCE9680595.1 TetR/AcrR family transcriptional regulator [Shewanella sp. AS1]
MQSSSENEKKRRGRHKLLSKEQIIDAAQAIITDPEAEFSMRELGMRLGVPHKTIYNYFDSREDLMKQVLSQAFSAIPRMSNDSPLSIREQLHNELRGWRDLMIWYGPFIENRTKIQSASANNDSLYIEQIAPSIQVLSDHGIPPLRALMVYATLLNWVLSVSRSMTKVGNWSKDYHSLRKPESMKNYPALNAAVMDECFPKTGNDYFEASLALLLDGLLGELS